MEMVMNGLFLLGASAMTLGLSILLAMQLDTGPQSPMEHRIVGSLIWGGLLLVVPTVVGLVALKARSW